MSLRDQSTADERAVLDRLPPERRAKIELALVDVRASRRRSVKVAMVAGVLVSAAAAAAIYFTAPKTPPRGAVGAVARIARADEGDCLVVREHANCFDFTIDLYEIGGRTRQVKLQTQVHDKWSSRVQPGSWVAVKVDPHSDEVFLDEDAFAVPPPASVGP